MLNAVVLSEQQISQRTEVQRIARRILSQCDGAKLADGVGFSRGNLTNGRAIAIAPIELWSDELMAHGAHILHSHRSQIAEDAAYILALCAEHADPGKDALPLMPAVLTLDPETRAPVIECEPTGGDKATRKSRRSEFSKIVGALGFIHGKDGRWELKAEVSLESLDNPVEALSQVGWFVLPEPTGFLRSYLTRARLLAEEVMVERQRARDELESREKTVAARQREFLDQEELRRKEKANAQSPAPRPPPRMAPDAFVAPLRTRGKDGRMIYALYFTLPEHHPHRATVLERLGQRLRKTQWPNSFLMDEPTPSEYSMVREKAQEWGLQFNDAR